MKYFKLPLYYQFDYIFDANDNIVINSMVDDKTTMFLVEKINDRPYERLNKVFYYEEGSIYSEGIEILMIRSWGRLTSTERLNPMQAKKAQDEFGEMITNKLNSL